MTNVRIMLWLVSLVSALGASPFCAGQGPIRIHYELKDSTLTLHEPVIVIFAVNNDSAHAMNVDLGIDKTQFFEFSVTAPDGQVFHGGPSLREGIHTLGDVTIGPGDTYKQELLLNQWFRFNSPGSYFLEARFNAKGSPLGNAPPTQGRWMRLEIKPRDIDRLKKRCAELTERAETARSVVSARDPALALSYVEDPIAVPYLARVLSEHTLSYELAVTGLERIGDKTAVEALVSALNDRYADIPELARRALERMAGRISDPKLKENVTRALAAKTDS